MRLQAALTLLILGFNSFKSNAFGSQKTSNAAFLTNRAVSDVFVPDSKGFITKSIITMSRGGAADESSLSASAVDEDVNIVPPSVEKHISTNNWNLLSEKGKLAIQNLIENDEGVGAQEHIYGGWPEVGIEDDGKISLADQVK